MSAQVIYPELKQVSLLAGKPRLITSIHASSVIISVWVRDEIHGPGFFSSVTDFTHVGRDHPVETLASVVLTTNF